jgi:hypothetical protein
MPWRHDSQQNGTQLNDTVLIVITLSVFVNKCHYRERCGAIKRTRVNYA